MNMPPWSSAHARKDCARRARRCGGEVGEPTVVGPAQAAWLRASAPGPPKARMPRAKRVRRRAETAVPPAERRRPVAGPQAEVPRVEPPSRDVAEPRQRRAGKRAEPRARATMGPEQADEAPRGRPANCVSRRADRAQTAPGPPANGRSPRCSRTCAQRTRGPCRNRGTHGRSTTPRGTAVTERGSATGCRRAWRGLCAQ